MRAKLPSEDKMDARLAEYYHNRVKIDLPAEMGQVTQAVLPDGIVATLERVEHSDPRIGGCKHSSLRPVGEGFPPKEGLGDKLANLFSSLGITQDTYKKMKLDFGLQGNCKCSWRQKGINWIGKKLGLSKGQGHDLQNLVAVLESPWRPTYDCKLHGLCVPQLPLADQEQRQISIDAGYTPCIGCPSHEPPKPKAEP
jgi:hypothetical protein